MPGLAEAEPSLLGLAEAASAGSSLSRPAAVGLGAVSEAMKVWAV